MGEGTQLTPEKRAHEFIWSTQHLGMWESARGALAPPGNRQGCLILGHNEGKSVGSPGSASLCRKPLKGKISLQC